MLCRRQLFSIGQAESEAADIANNHTCDESLPDIEVCMATLPCGDRADHVPYGGDVLTVREILEAQVDADRLAERIAAEDAKQGHLFDVKDVRA